MVDTTAQFAHQVQDIVRSMFGNVQGMTEVQREIAQRLASVQQELISETTEATREELELLSRVRDPREFATAQAELVRRHGQRYVDSVKQSVEIVADAWQSHGDRLAQGVKESTDKTRRAQGVDETTDKTRRAQGVKESTGKTRRATKPRS